MREKRKKVGRPTLPKGEAKSHCISVSRTGERKEGIQKAAKAAGQRPVDMDTPDLEQVYQAR